MVLFVWDSFIACPIGPLTPPTLIIPVWLLVPPPYYPPPLWPLPSLYIYASLCSCPHFQGTRSPVTSLTNKGTNLHLTILFWHFLEQCMLFVLYALYMAALVQHFGGLLMINYECLLNKQMKNILPSPSPPKLTDHLIMIVCTTKLFYAIDRYHISCK
jgi:hypothetical protein